MRAHAGGLEMAIHVVARARRTVLDGRHGAALKLRVAAPPVEGAANRAVIAFFAELLHVPRSRLRLVSGEHYRDKVLRIEDFSLDDLRKHLPGIDLEPHRL
jgi:uncharacterized protein (TIGR00251 family)